jgi:AcrR family transcriptional regulator
MRHFQHPATSLGYDAYNMTNTSRGTRAKLTLQEAKQDLVRDAITNAALDLFFAKGFDETTVEEIAKAAGVSRRTFFRYFSSKSDVIGQISVALGPFLSSAISAAPRTYSPLEVLRDAVLRVASAAAEFPRTKQLLRITEAHPEARQAQMARNGEIEDHVARALAPRLKAPLNRGRPRLMAGLMVSIVHIVLRLWVEQENADVAEVAEQVLTDFQQLFGVDTTRQPRVLSRAE